MVKIGRHHLGAIYDAAPDQSDPLSPSSSFAKPLDALAGSPHVEADGPTVGPNGIEIPYELPPCVLANGKPAEIGVFVDHQNVQIVYGSGLTGYSAAAFNGIELYEPPSAGIHQLSFACYPYESPEPGTIVLGAGWEWSASATWKDEGFAIEVTGPGEPVSLSTHVAGPGYLVTTTSGAPAGPHPCPSVPGGPWLAVHISLYVASFYYNVPSEFVYEERFSLSGSSATSWPIAIPPTMQADDTLFATVECSHLTSGPGAYDARFLYNWDERYNEALIRLTAPVGGALASWETYGGRNAAEAGCVCAEGWSGDPVNTATGEYSEADTDASVKSIGNSMAATRTYSSGRAGIDGPFGYGWSSAYMPKLDVTPSGATVTEESGAEVRYEVKESKYVAPPRVTATLSKTGDGSYIFTTRQPAHHLAYTFDQSGRLQSIGEPDGVAVSVSYPSATRVVVGADGGRTLTYTMSEGHVSSVSDSAGAQTSYEYDLEGNLVKVTDPLGRSASYTYDAAHRLLTRADPDDAKTENVYSPEGQVLKQTDPLGQITSYSYESEPGVTLETSPSGTVTRYEYEFGFMRSKIVGFESEEPAESYYEYDPITGAQTSVFDPGGPGESRTLDGEGNALTRYVGSQVTKYTYNQLGEVSTETDADITTTTYEYDSGGELLSKTTPLGEGQPAVTSKWSYGSGAKAGELLTSTDPDGHTTHYAYDDAGDLASVTDALGDKTTMTYDADGRLRTTTTPNGNLAGAEPAAHTTTDEYDADGRLTSITDPLAGVTRYAYDPDGRQTSVQDPSGRATTFIYDLDGQRTSVKHGDEAASRTKYGTGGQVLQREDPAGHTTTYGYDTQGYRDVVTADGATTKTTFDLAGRPTQVQLPSGQITSYEYDEQGRLRVIFYSDAKTSFVENTYDAQGRRTQQRTSTGTCYYAYDALGRLTSETDQAAKTISYGYDPDGNLTAITYPNSKTVKHNYDAAGHLTQIEDWLGHSTQFAYDADGNREQETLPGGVRSSSTFDADDDLTDIADVGAEGPLSELSYLRDKAGRLTSASATASLAASATYGYDQSGRLAAEGQTALSYDASANPTSYVTGSLQHYNGAEELTDSNTPGVPIVESPEAPGEEHKAPAEGHEEHKEEVHLPSVQLHEEHHEGAYEPYAYSHEFPAAHKGSAGQGAGNGVLGEMIQTPRLTAKSSVRAANAHGVLAAHLARVSDRSLLLALISVPAGSHPLAPSGPGLSWHIIAHQSDPGGSVLLASARATHALRGASASVRGLTPHAAAMLSVVQFAPSAQISAARAAKGHSGSPALKLAAKQGSEIWAIAHDTQRAGAHPAGATLSDQLRMGAGSTWVQHQLAKQSATAEVADTSPTAGSWALAAVAVGASPGAVTSQAHTPPRASSATATDSPTQARSPASSQSGDAMAGAADQPAPTRTFTYDASGERLTEALDGHETHFSYDQAGRLIAVGRLATYNYDGDGLRTGETVDTASTAFTWGHAESLPMLLQAGATDYIYGPDGAPIEQITEETPTYLLQDAEGSTRMLTNSEGKLTGTYSYDAWGNISAHSGSATSNLQYDGQYRDEETGYEYLRGRYYDPSTGQFLTPDPGFATTLARYAYAEDDPLNAEDPSGLFCIVGHDPNGACRGSNLGNDVHAIGTGAAVTGIVAGVVIISVGTGGIADEVAADAALVGLAADGVGAYSACDSAPNPWSRQCAGGLGKVGLDYASFGLGSTLTGRAAGVFGVTSGLGAYGYSQWAEGQPGQSAGGLSNAYSYCEGAAVFKPTPSGQLSWQASYGSYLQP